jgi:hypothetical protein
MSLDKKFNSAYERALKRAEKAKQAFDNLPALDATEKELCLQYINGDSVSTTKLRAIGLYKKRNGQDLSTAKEKIETYIQAYIKQQ